MTKVVYICKPFQGDIAANRSRVRHICAAVKRVFRWPAEGRSLPSIAKALNEEKAPTRNGGTWRPSTIQGMLRNRFYTGQVGFDGELIRAQHDAIVADVLFDKCGATAAERAAIPPIPQPC